MKKPTIHKKLTLKELQKRHEKYTQDKPLHDFLEAAGRKDTEQDFNLVIEEAGKLSKPELLQLILRDFQIYLYRFYAVSTCIFISVDL